MTGYSPRSLIDKLGVKPGARVAVLGIEDGDFEAELATRTTDVARIRPRKGSDMIFFGVERKTALERLRTLKNSIKPNGAVWVLWPKGRRELTENDVRAAALAHGLVDIKVVAFSATHGGLKLVIPVAQRPGGRSGTRR
jgi:hypothetical protein